MHIPSSKTGCRALLDESSAGEPREVAQGAKQLRSSVEANDPWADLIVALLSVNNYPLEKTFGLSDRLAEAELFDPAKLQIWDLREISQRLGQAGYDRGPAMTQIFSERLPCLGEYLVRQGAENCARLLASGSRAEITDLLSTAKGIGSRVLENFFLLRGTPK